MSNKHLDNKSTVDRLGIAPDLIWPRTDRESAIFKQQSKLKNKFDWGSACIGWTVAQVFWFLLHYLYS